MKILIIRTHRLGDILQLTPLLPGLKKKYSGAEITWITGDNFAGILDDHPGIDELLAIPEREYRYLLADRPDRFPCVYNEMYDFCRLLGRRKFDLVINRQYEVGSLISFLAGARAVRGGSYSPERSFVMEDSASRELYQNVKSDRKGNRMNLADWSLLIAGLAPGCAPMNLPVTEADRIRAEELIAESERSAPIAAVQMGAGRSFRQWGTENYRKVIRTILERTNYRIVLLGTGEEKEAADSILGDPSLPQGRIVNLAGRTPLKTLRGVLEWCRVLITGDTGTMHMAAAVGTRVIAIFYGTAYPWETGPYGDGHLILYSRNQCAPCREPEKCGSGQKCRSAIKPDHVWRAFEIQEAISAGGTARSAGLGEDVDLYITAVREGTGQELIPFPDRSARPGNALRRPEVVPGNTVGEIAANLQKKKKDMIRSFYLAHSDAFFSEFSSYIDDLICLAGCLQAPDTAPDIRNAFESILPYIGSATAAMQSRDLVSLKDILQYRLDPFLQEIASPVQNELR
ncbi:MAG: glycosyltransferase family 9 protein [Syntrophales bacterium]|nr:glycosyltransferase family 9 protein [Syntrophales bacterium]MDD5532267.1 glycosyltransferase family 9 protein [Syntrophales bacterium]